MIRMIRMIRMIIPCRASQTRPSRQPGGTSGRPPAPRRPKMLKTLQFPRFGRPTGQLPSLSEISDKVPTRSQIVCFPKMFQQLRPDCAPDCSQSNIVGAGRSRIILRHIIMEAYFRKSHRKLVVISGRTRGRRFRGGARDAGARDVEPPLRNRRPLVRPVLVITTKLPLIDH